MILCCGEALIDFLPARTEQGQQAFQPFAGGSIFNVAIALGRLGTPVGFLGGLSRDFFGDMLRDALKESRVDSRTVILSDRPTTLAFVTLDHGQPRYAFLDEGSAARMIRIEDLPDLPHVPDALHFGSISLISEPGAATLEHLAAGMREKAVISIDPNIRPSMVADRDAYLERLNRMVGMADIIKISDEDMEWMFPDREPAKIVRTWLDAGTALVVLTRGGEGAHAFTRRFEVFQPVHEVAVADTVGAGDTFIAGLLSDLDHEGVLTRDGLHALEEEQVACAMDVAAKAAAITVSRSGANPPWDHELALNRERPRDYKL